MFENYEILLHTLTGIFGLGVSYLSYFLIRKHLLSLKYSHIPGPANYGIFEYIVGNQYEFIKTIKNGKTVQDKHLEWNQKYGSVFKFHLLGDICISVSDSDVIRDLLVENPIPKYKGLVNKVAFPFNIRASGDGLFGQTDHEKWKKQRAALNSAFHKSAVLNHMKEFNEKGNILMQKLRHLADGETIVHIGKEMNAIALDIIASLLFGLNANSINNENDELSYILEYSFRGVTAGIMDPFLAINPFKRKEYNEYVKVFKDLRQYAKDKILERINKIENNEYVPNDIFTILINNCKDEQVDVDYFIDEFITFFGAGQETTANTLAFALLELGRSPEKLKKLQEEVDRVLGSKTEITTDDLFKLEYTECVFKEALRKWPTASEIHKQTNRDLNVNGYKIPKDTWIMISMYVCSRDEKNFPNPDEFLPERFAKNSENQNISNYTYFPFSIGPRQCIGRNFAMIEGQIILAKFIQNFSFELDSTQSFDAIQYVTLKPKDGVRARLKIRD